MSIVVKDLKKSLGNPPQAIIKGMNFEINSGEFIAITGRSGSGKSTLLYLVSSLDRPTGGTVEIDGHDLSRMNEADLHAFRNERMGFVFQFHYLLPELNALENILLPARKMHHEKDLEKRARELLHDFDLDAKCDSMPSELSGGEQQRVAIARALIMNPQYIFADEPTGSLDSVSGRNVMHILREISSDRKTTVIMVTHDAGYAAMADRQLVVVDGLLSQELSNTPGVERRANA